MFVIVLPRYFTYALHFYAAHLTTLGGLAFYLTLPFTFFSNLKFILFYTLSRRILRGPND